MGGMRWQFLHRWWMPFAVLTTASAVSVPVAMYLQHGMATYDGADLGLAYGNAWVLRDDVLATIVVYALNLMPVIWLFNADGSTRWAAFWASLLGLSKVVGPVALASMSDASVLGGPSYVDWHTLRILIWFQDAQMVVFGIMLWMAFGRFVGDSHSATEHSGHYAEA